MSLIPLLLLFGVEQIPLGLSVPDYILISLLYLLLLYFFDLSLGLLLQLVMQWDEQVTFPDIELRLQSVILADGREERFVLRCKLTQLLQLLLHAEDNLLALLGV